LNKFIDYNTVEKKKGEKRGSKDRETEKKVQKMNFMKNQDWVVRVNFLKLD